MNKSTVTELNRTVFISYSHTPEENKQWVKKFAANLTANGIKVMYDQNLALGTHLPSFMREGICDKSIDKVLVVCNSDYVKKADSKEKGGVTAETILIIEELSGTTEQTRIVPIIKEQLESGEVCMPAHLRSYFGIDFCDKKNYGKKLKELVNYINNVREYKPQQPQGSQELVRKKSTDLNATHSSIKDGDYPPLYICKSSINAIVRLKRVLEKNAIIESAFSYLGYCHASSWIRACENEDYHVMHQGIARFGGLLLKFPELKNRIENYISLGIGSGVKDAAIINYTMNSDRSSRFKYCAVDISSTMLYKGGERVLELSHKLLPRNMKKIVCDFSDEDSLSELSMFIGEFSGETKSKQPKLFSLLGNTLANFDDDVLLLKKIALLLSDEDYLLLEVAMIGAIDDNNISESIEEYNQAAFKSFAIQSVRHCLSGAQPIRDIDIKFKHDIDDGYALKISAYIERDPSLCFHDNKRITSKSSEIRVYLTRKYTLSGVSSLLHQANFDVVRFERFEFDRKSELGNMVILAKGKTGKRFNQRIQRLIARDIP